MKRLVVLASLVFAGNAFAQAAKKLTIAIYAPNAPFATGQDRFNFVGRLAAQITSVAGVAAEGKSFTNSADFDVMPDATTAPIKCSAFATKFWSRDPDTDEVASCVDVALNGAANEPAARRKWAYTCASVLSSAPFLTF